VEPRGNPSVPRWVIPQDLVGGFGEVQVMDWGLAKVLVLNHNLPGLPSAR